MRNWIERKVALNETMRPVKMLRGDIRRRQEINRKELLTHGVDLQTVDTLQVALQRGIMAGICQVG